MNRLPPARLSPILFRVAGLVAVSTLFAATASAQTPTKPTPPASPTSPVTKPAPASPATAPATSPTTSASANGEVAPAGACTITVNGDSLRVSPMPISARASLSAAIGDSISATLPPDSKISVVSVAPAMGKEVRLTLNTQDAAPGEYKILLHGNKGDCSGTLRITTAGAK